MADNNTNTPKTPYATSGNAVRGFVQTEKGQIATVQSRSAVEAMEHAIRLRNINDEFHQRIALINQEELRLKAQQSELNKDSIANAAELSKIKDQLASQEEAKRRIEQEQTFAYQKQALQMAYENSLRTHSFSMKSLADRQALEKAFYDNRKQELDNLEQQRANLLAEANYIPENVQEQVTSEVQEEHPELSEAEQNAEIERRLGEIRTAQLEAVNGDIAKLSDSIQAINGQLLASEQNQKQYDDAVYAASLDVLKGQERYNLIQQKANTAKQKATNAEINYLAQKKLIDDKRLKGEQVTQEEEQALADAQRDADMAKQESTQAQSEAQAASWKESLKTAIANAIKYSMAKLLNGVDNAIEDLTNGFGKVNARIQGATGVDSFQKMVDNVQYRVGLNPLVSQKAVIDNIRQIVDAGVAYNIEQRAFLQSISDRIATTFDAFDSNLLRIIRLQQADSTGARLGMEARLTQFFNEMYQDTSYLNNEYDTVTQNLMEATSQMNRNQSIEFEYTVQKWLGSLSSLGLSTNTISTLSQAISNVASGNVEALSSNTEMQNLVAMSAAKAGLDYAKILTGGMEGDTANKLLQSMVEYLREIATSEKNLVVKQAYGSVFGMSMSDFRAISNLQNEDISAISAETMTYQNAIRSLNQQMNYLVVRTPIQEMMSNLFSNATYMIADGIVSNPATYALWEINKMVEEATGGINLPAGWAAGFGLDLNANVNQLLSLGMVGIGTMSMIPKIIGSIANGGGLDLSKWNGSEYTVRGQGFQGITAGSLKDTSFSAQVGNASSSDMFSSTVGNAVEESSSTQDIISQANENETKAPEKNTDDIFALMDEKFNVLIDSVKEISENQQNPLLERMFTAM